MGDKLKDKPWTVEKIVEIYRKEKYTMEEENKEPITSLYIRNKIKEILKEIDCPESVFRSRAKKQDGHFIFCGDDVPNTIREIIKFYNLNKKIIHESFRSDEEDILTAMLFSIRPLSNRKSCNNMDIEQKEALKKFYISKYLKTYEQQWFLKVNVKDGKPDKLVRFQIYKYQLALINDWYVRLSYIMKLARSLRINDRIFNGYMCGLNTVLTKTENREKFYLEGDWFDELEDYLKLDRIGSKEIYNECYNMYFWQSGKEESIETNLKEKLTYERCYKECKSKVKKILSNSLMETAIDDYLYILHRAMEELDNIHKKLEEELEREKECDEIICGLKQIEKMIREKGLEGKKYKRLEKILDEFIGKIDSQNIFDEIEDICTQIRNIINEESDCSIAEKKIIYFCEEEIEKYYRWIRREKKMEVKRLNQSEYRKYFSKEKEIVKKDVQELVKENFEFFMGIKRNHWGLKKISILDYIPDEEYWDLNEFCTGRKQI